MKSSLTQIFNSNIWLIRTDGVRLLDLIPSILLRLTRTVDNYDNSLMSKNHPDTFTGAERIKGGRLPSK